MSHSNEFWNFENADRSENTPKGYFKPLFHYSESHPDKPNPRSHADMPSKLPKDGGFSFPVDYDVELKAKDDAIRAIETCPIS